MPSSISPGNRAALGQQDPRCRGWQNEVAMADLKQYKGILPYASELFGIYQPLLGWKSRIVKARFDGFRATLYQKLANRMLTAVSPPVLARFDGDRSDERAPLFPLQGIKLQNLRAVKMDSRRPQ